ncbi:MAG: phosphoribosylformylglycinamidine synthase [Patescibacteria group bacterium]|nr:phosphoribosylformylglycinamidine synthase [Patescibacteria group bacterium]
MTQVKQLYRLMAEGLEHCFNVELSSECTDAQLNMLCNLFADGFIASTVTFESQLDSNSTIIEIGPNGNVVTPWSSNMVSICRAIGLDMVTRVERSSRYVLDGDVNRDVFIAENYDRMREAVYDKSLTTFDTGIEPEAVYDVDMISGGPDALKEIPGISMDEDDRNFYYDYFVVKNNRNPTIVEIMDLNNANSDHSRHGFFGGKQKINGVMQQFTLFDLVKQTNELNPQGSVIAFKDNSSASEGYEINTLIPNSPGKFSALSMQVTKYHVTLTAETHNFPSGVAPFPGAETGAGGRIRDNQGTGKGSFVVAGTTGYCVANLHIPGYELPWETAGFEYPDNLARALQIELEASDGASDYGNKFGEPMIQGFTRAFDMRLPSGERWGWLKPIMYTGGIGQIDARHTEKDTEEKGMKIVQVGGPAYRVGFGGGAASSMLQGSQAAELDFNAVQRGDAEMEQKMNRVIRACNEMGDETLIDVIHDQGAGGPANVLKELVEHSGGTINIRNIIVGDSTMSVLEIYVAEFQERMGFLISPENIKQFQAICEREKVGCEVLGDVTGDMQFIVRDSSNDTTPVNLDLSKVLSGIPQKIFEDKYIHEKTEPVRIPDDVTVRSVLHDVLRLVSVGSKRFLTNKADRTVTGLVAQQQCVGSAQLPLSNVAVTAQSHFSLTGCATAIGEQPIKMLVDPAAGARRAVGEVLTNLMWVDGIDLSRVKCSANWMWAPKLPGEGAALRKAVTAMCDAMMAVGIAVDGGKDSLSMATHVGDEIVKSPRQLVIAAYNAVPDITKVVTPDIKKPGKSKLIFIDLSDGKMRLGGTALAQVYGQIGDESPDMDDPALVRNAFLAIQKLIDKGLILAGHDISDGGLITTLLEMAFAGNCGMDVNIEKIHNESVMERMFAEELGVVIEVDDADKVLEVLSFYNLPIAYVIGETLLEQRIDIVHNGVPVLSDYMVDLRQNWEETSYQLERLQKNPVCADAEKDNIYERNSPKYYIPFVPGPTSLEILEATDKPKVAILRDEGSNSDREMTSFFYSAGFEPWDITMTDLLTGRVKDLNQFVGLAAVGGFSYADVPESAKGWAATIMFNEGVKAIFEEFYNRPDTFSLGICNGCQLFGLIGWVPWRDIAPEDQPRFVHNDSGKFESRWSMVDVLPNNAIMLKNMDGMQFGINVAHGEGKLVFPNPEIAAKVSMMGLAPLAFVDDDGNRTQKYPFNPNGSEGGLTALCTEDGRHLAMMPHPERTFLSWQCHYLPEDMKVSLQNNGHASPWMKMAQNAYNWCTQK